MPGETTTPLLDRAVRPARWLAIAAAVGVLAVLLWPSRPAGADQDGLARWLRELHEQGRMLWLTFGGIEFAANVAMFVPLGVLAALARPRGGAWVALAGCAGLSAMAELGQWLLLPQRTGDLRDVVANTVGAAIGVGVVAWLRARRAAR